MGTILARDEIGVDSESAADGSPVSAGEAATVHTSEISVRVPWIAAPPLDGVADAVEQARVFEALFDVPAERRRMGRYVVLDTLGAGAMGTVLEAFDRILDRRVALKVMHRELDQRDTKRLLREAQALAKLSHPNVVQVYDSGEVEGQTFIAMELVRGQSLRAWLQQDPHPGWRECLQVYLQAGEGLAAAHNCGLVHRDFKPSNAVIDDEGRVRVLDFGLARGEEERSEPPSMHPELAPDDAALDTPLTRTGAVLGTPAYMPLEQMQGIEADARSDQFGFCASLYEAVYGERPFEGSSLMALMVSMTAGAVRPAPRTSRVPTKLRATLLRGLATDPADRWPSMEALLVELRKLTAPRSRRWIGGVGLALAAVASVVVLRQSGELSEKDEEISAKDEQLTDKEQQLHQELDANLRLTEEVKAELAVQKGLRAKDVAEDPGRELEAVRLAVEAFEDFDLQADTIPTAVFEGLTHALAGIDRGIALRGHTGRVVAAAISSDGRWTATAGHDRTARLWDAASGASVRTLDHHGYVLATGFSPDGARLATGADDGTALVWDIATGEPVESLRHQGAVQSVGFASDGRAVATASGDVAWVWHEGPDAVVVPLRGHTDRVRSVVFSADGQRLWTASDDRTVRLWNVETGAVVQTLEGHTGPIYDVAVSRDGTRLATASGDLTARLWDATNGDPIASFQHGEVVSAVAISPDGTQVATGTFDDNSAHLWDTENNQRVRTFHHAGPVVDVVFSPCGHQLVTASRDGTARSWDLGRGGAMTSLQGHADRVDAVVFSPEGDRLATASGDGTARLWDAESGRHLATLRGHTLDVLAVAFSSSGSQLVTGSWDGTARVWNAASATLLRTLEGHTGPVSAVAVSRDDSRVATGSRDGTARVWDIATGHALRSVPHEGPVVDVVFDPGGRRLLTLDAENTVRMWDVATGDALPGLPHGIRATALAFSADGERIVVATEDDSLQVLGAESGEPIRTFQGHAGPVLAVAFSIDGMLLASTSEDGTAKVWDRSSGRLLATFPHEGSVTAVSFSGDGTRLATASKDRAARQWHDGARLATASTDQTAWLWSLEPQRWLPWGCAVLDGRRAHSEITRRACARATASELVPSVSEIVVEPSSRITAAAASVPEAGKPAPDLITVHGVELVLVPGGTFTMGSPSDEYGRSVIEGPQHEVTLASFYLARTELTNAQYALYLEANPDGRAPPFGHYERYNKPEQPVVGLSWDDAKAYCDWAGLSLPTEAQWEYAARAGSTTAYWFGHEADDLERFGWTVADAAGSMERSRTHSVGTKGPNPWGLYDMHGNVWEWCLDGYAPYTVGVRAADGLRRRPAGIVHRVLRGGSFVYWPDAARSAVRFRSRPGNHTRDVGFRPAMRLP